jgi:hypothetical protein
LKKTTLYGLEVRQRKVAYGNVDSRQATEIFIRSALVEEAVAGTCARPARTRRFQSLTEPACNGSARAKATAAVAMALSNTTARCDIRLLPGKRECDAMTADLD